MCVYGDSKHAQWFQEAWAKTGKKLDMGKSCVRFKKVEDLPLDVIGEAIQRMPAKKYIEHCESALRAAKEPASKPAGKPGKSEESTRSRKSQTAAGKTKRSKN
jgi:hypothetical protein